MEGKTHIQTDLAQKYRLIMKTLYWSAGCIDVVLRIRIRNLVPVQGGQPACGPDESTAHQDRRGHQASTLDSVLRQGFKEDLRLEWSFWHLFSILTSKQLTELNGKGWLLREIQHISGHKSLEKHQKYLNIKRNRLMKPRKKIALTSSSSDNRMIKRLGLNSVQSYIL